MIITCPSCQTRYKVDPKNFGAKGRRVRCTNCKETWNQGPADEAPRAVDPEAPLDQGTPDQDTPDQAGAAAAEAAPAVTVSAAAEPKPETESAGAAPEPEPKAEPEPEPAAVATAAAAGPTLPAQESGLTEKLELPSVAAAGPNRPSADGAPAKAAKPSSLIGWMALLTIVLAIVVGGVLTRDSIVRAWPPAERLYKAAGLSTNGAAGLRIEVESHNHTVEDDRTFLVVRGKVTNTSGKVREVPELQAWIRGEDSRELANWTFTAAQTRLLPGETASFITRFQNPPTGGTGLAIDFAQRGP
ncbi:MAG: zinc-ribbon domain-containing protein [Alphaproteobacteria bacterium]|nr:zinc-ribbon domain-containing protein [Alphaproteobacteria bacterium]